MNRLTRTFALLAGGTMLLSGCVVINGVSSPSVPGELTESLVNYVVELPGELVVDCVGSRYSSSLIYPSCNWGNIRTPSPSEELAETFVAYSVETLHGGTVLCVGSRYAASVVAPDCDWASVAAR